MELDCANGIIKEGLQCEDLRALITQREGVNQYGDPTDVLEAAYIRFYELLGFLFHSLLLTTLKTSASYLNVSVIY